ncbi:response regulator [Natronospirillum operosum]|nr:response regulator [Natronospirillum operosum]
MCKKWLPTLRPTETGSHPWAWWVGLGLWLLTAPAHAVLTLTDDRSRYDLHQHTAGLWLQHWEPEPDLEWPEGQSMTPSRGWSDDIFHWSANISNESTQTNWYVVIRNPSLDLLRVYLDLPDTDRYVQMSDYMSPSQRLFPGNHFIIPLQIEPGTRQTLYITGTSDDWQFYPMMLVDQTGYQTFAQQEMLLIGAATGLLLALFLFNLLQTVLKGHWSFVWVAIAAMAWALQVWYWFGLGHLWLWPEWPWLQNRVWYLLLAVTGVSLLGSVIAALSAFLDRTQKGWLYSAAIGGFLTALVLQLVVPPATYLWLIWGWYSTTAAMIYWHLHHTRALRSLHIVLFGFSLLAGGWFALMSWAPVLQPVLVTLFILLFLLLTGLHSFVVYWQYHHNQQKAWADLRARSQAFADVADEHREQLNQYRTAALLGKTWRGTLNDHIEARLQQVSNAVVSLRQAVQADERHALLNTAQQAVRDGLGYVQDLQTLERLLTRDYAVENEPLDLRAWLTQFEDWFDQYQTRQEEHPLYFRTELLSSDMPPLTGPATTLKMVLLRLLDNAIQYTDSGFIKLLVQAEGQTRHRVNTRFELRDSGHGMDDLLLQDIQRFWQDGIPALHAGDQEEADSRLGSGLTIALFLLRQLGARLQVQSTPEAGTSIVFWLWLDREQTRQRSRMVEHWLIVDDSPTLYQEAGEHLTPGVDVHWVKNGQIALTTLREQAFDVIIIDLAAQLVDGIEFTRFCREREDGNRFAWIIGLAPAGNSKLAQHARQAGINEVVQRPQSDSELRAWLRLLIKRMFRNAEDNGQA